MRRFVGSFAIASLFALAACSSLSREPGPTHAPQARAFPRTVVLFLRDGSQLQLFEARIAGDSIHGEFYGGEPIAVASAQVARIETRRFSALKTGLLLSGALAAVIVIILNTDAEPLRGVDY